MVECADEQLQVGGAGIIGQAFEGFDGIFVHVSADVFMTAHHVELFLQGNDVVGVCVGNAAGQPLHKVGLPGEFLLRTTTRGVERAQVVSLVDLVEVAPGGLVGRMQVDVLVPLFEEVTDLGRIAMEQDRVVELFTRL